MKIIIMGCGRVGEQLARLMAEQGDEVVVIDQDPAALARLGPEFPGKTVRGIGFDRQVLLMAGIAEADAFAATSNSDNANIIAARIARNVFGVPRVVTRLYDPGRAEVYRRLGLMTISSTTWGAERIREMISHSDLDPERSFGNGEVVLVSIEIPYHLAGRFVKDLNVAGEFTVVVITREGKAFMPISGTEFREGDIVTMIVLSSAVDRLMAMLGFTEGG
jgi:trk system potassium uptake protein TrkA